MLLEANRIEQVLKTNVTTAKAIFHEYTAADHPWCMLDTHYRHMERRYYDFNFELHDRLEPLLIMARNRYMEVGSMLAEAFLRAQHRVLSLLRRHARPFIAKIYQDGGVVVWLDESAWRSARSKRT